MFSVFSELAMKSLREVVASQGSHDGHRVIVLVLRNGGFYDQRLYLALVCKVIRVEAEGASWLWV